MIAIVTHVNSVPRAANTNRPLHTLLALSLAELIGAQLRSLVNFALHRAPSGP